jgi:hypothetical protein
MLRFKFTRYHFTNDHISLFRDLGGFHICFSRDHKYTRYLFPKDDHICFARDYACHGP